MLMASTLGGAVLPLAAAEPLKLVTEVEPPYVLPPGDPRGRGIDVDIVQAAMQQGGGPPIQLLFVPFRRALLMMESGDADLMLGLSRTPERERYLLFSRPYGHEASYCFLRGRDRPAQVRSLADLGALRVGLVSGFVYPAALTAALGPARIMANDRSALLRMVAAGRADVAVMERLIAVWLLMREGFSAQLRAEDFVLSGSGAPQLAFSRRSARAVAALAPVNRGLNLLQAGGWHRFEAPYSTPGTPSQHHPA